MQHKLADQRVLAEVNGVAFDVQQPPPLFWAKCKVCCCQEHCGYSLHLSAKINKEVVHLAMEIEGLSMDTLMALEEKQTEYEKGLLTGIFDSLNLDVSAVFSSDCSIWR